MSDEINKSAGDVWFCKIGPAPVPVPMGGDWPMRKAVQEAFCEMFGVPAVVFSGWGQKFSEAELAVIENREPECGVVPDADYAEIARLRADLARVTAQRDAWIRAAESWRQYYDMNDRRWPAAQDEARRLTAEAEKEGAQ